MVKENNCRCVVCDVERGLLNSLNSQTARTHFQAFARNHAVLKHFDSPADVIAQLHEHERVEAANHNAWNGILHVLVESIADRTAEEIGQQLLLLAYMPAIHKVHREVCQKFPGLCSEDIAQQAAVCFLETVRTPEMHTFNGHLSAALARRFRQSLFRWAIGETRQSLALQQVTIDPPEPPTRCFEHAIALERILEQAKRDSLLSEAEYQLLLKFKWEGFEANELVGMNLGSTTNAVQMRLKRIIKRLRHAFADAQTDSAGPPEPTESKNISSEETIFSGEMCIRKSEKGFSPERSHPGPQLEPKVPPIAA
jgi:hypothetical protein